MSDDLKKLKKLKILPSIQEVLEAADLAGIADVYRTRLARETLARFRERVQTEPRAFKDRAAITQAIVEETRREARELLASSPKRVINGTGVVIHTNLGRAPLGPALDELDLAALTGYSNLEWDVASQKRSSRDRHLGPLLRLVTGAEAAIAVNNCAGALLIALNTIARDRDVLVSRSELVEIGGGFRVPEIMEASGCRLVEVGTTNKTRIEDYVKRSKPKPAALLKVHQSNFVQKGFVQSVSLAELTKLGNRLRVPVVYDNGSGLLTSSGLPFLKDEPTIEQNLKDGASIVVCSADKLLGSAQAGLILGKRNLVERMARNPLYRALRLDKVRIALLRYTLTQYLTGRQTALPVWQMTTARLEHCPEKLRLPEGVEWVALKAETGGGSNPERAFDSLGLRFSRGSAQSLKETFATRAIPILGYIHGGAFHLDVRTFLPDDFTEAQKALDELGPSC